MNLRTVKAYLFKEDFDHLWAYNGSKWVSGFIDQWIRCIIAVFLS